MGFIDRNLMSGEQIISRARLHWAVLLGPAALSTVCLVGTIVVAAYGGGKWTYVPLVLLAISLLSGLGKYVSRVSTEFGVTNYRVLVKVGLISIRSTEILLPKIEAVQIEQNLWGRLLDYGTVIITGTGGTHEVFPLVESPYELRNQIQSQLVQSPQPEPPPPGPTLRF